MVWVFNTDEHAREGVREEEKAAGGPKRVSEAFLAESATCWPCGQQNTKTTNAKAAFNRTTRVPPTDLFLNFSNGFQKDDLLSLKYVCYAPII